MLLARQLTTKTMLQIGNFYGGRDHTTVLHALRSTEEKLAKDSQLAHALDSIKDQLKQINVIILEINTAKCDGNRWENRIFVCG